MLNTLHNNTFVFANNRETVNTAFKDYMNHYFSEVERKDGYSFDSSISFAEKEAKMNTLLREEIKRISHYDFEDDIVSSAAWADNPNVKWAVFAVMQYLIDSVLPDTIIRSIGMFAEIKVGSWGDSFQWNIEPNDLFYVSKAGYDMRTIEFQRQYRGLATVVPENRMVTVYVNLYRVLCGMDSLARFVSKVLISIETQITKEAWTAFDTAMAELPTTPADGVLQVTGWTQAAAVKLAQTVSAYNGGAKAVFVGTPLALSHVLPDDANYRYMLDGSNSEYMRLGYVRTAFGYDVLAIPQYATWDSNYELALDDDKIYVVSPSSDKLLKIAFEGETRSNHMGAYESADLREQTTIYKAWGMAVATNSIAGLINLT